MACQLVPILDICVRLISYKVVVSVRKVFDKSRVKSSVAANGNKVRSQDDVYFDTQASRRRANKWQRTKYFKLQPYVEGLLVFIVIWMFVALLTTLLLIGYDKVNGLFDPSGASVYASLGIMYRGTVFKSVFVWSMFKSIVLLLSALGGVIIGLIRMKYNRRIASANSDEDINDYEGDASVMTIPELVLKYKPMPDQGAHSHSINANGLVAHIALNNKGVHKQMMPVWHYVGGKTWETAKKREIETETVIKNGHKVERNKVALQELIDEDDALRQLKNVGMTDTRYLKLQSPNKLIYHGASKKTLADFINEDWWMPDYETQKPSGAFLVDESAMNTMIVAMTRGNKGQSIINPMIDIWSRQDKKQNIFCNDPKGELYTGFMAILKLRGYDTVVFNLLDSRFTDKYNPLAEAINYVRKGYRDEPQKVLTNLVDNFFPIPKGGDPFWTKAERTLFNMLALALMDLYYEEEQEYLEKYGTTYDASVIAEHIDELWSHVTLSNVYRMVSALATHKFQPHDLDGEISKDADGAEEPETDQNMLDKLFEATNALPASNVRELFSSPYANFLSMADSEKMRASIYGLTLTEMGLFTEGPIMDLTNASPKESFDLLSMSFPRRFEFKFNDAYIKTYGFLAQAVDFELYKDPFFKEKYEGKDFEHSTRIDEQSWVEMRFAAVLPQPITYVKVIIRPRGVKTDQTYAVFYGQFTKGYEKDDQHNFVRDAITGNWIIRDGTLRMSKLDKNGGLVIRPKKDPVTHKMRRSKIDPKQYQPVFLDPDTGEYEPVFELTEVSYIERPQAVFSVTPPSSLVYVKIVLMLIHSMFNSNVENSYLTKDNSKPLLETKYMLDELGNLSYDGAGISALTTKLSIGLAQGQMFTLVFQTLQQIKDVYGETADRIISGNTGLTTFLLSNDLDMLGTLSQQAGVVHRGRTNSKNFTQHVGSVNDTIDDAVSFTQSVTEEPLFSVGRLLSMTKGEALMLSSTKRETNDGSNSRQQPIFDTKSTSLPMAWSLHKFGYMQNSFSMQTVPTASTSMGQKNRIPDFEALIYKRALQAGISDSVKQNYLQTHNLSAIQFGMLDPKEIGRVLMHEINKQLHGGEDAINASKELQSDSATYDVNDAMEGVDMSEILMDDSSDLDKYESDTSYKTSLDADLERPTRERELEQQALKNSVSGMTAHVNPKTNQIQLDNVSEDKDVTTAKQSSDVKQSERQRKRFGRNMFSEEDLTGGPFKSALAQSMLSFPGTYSRGGLQIVDRDTPNVPTKLVYREDILAVRRKVEQTKVGELIDGDASVKVSEVKSTGVSWDIEDKFLIYLHDDAFWNVLPKTPDFIDILVKQYKQQVGDKKTDPTVDRV